MAQEKRSELMYEFHGTIIIFLLSHFVIKIINHILSRRHKPILTCPKLIHKEGNSLTGNKNVCVYSEMLTSAAQEKAATNCQASPYGQQE